MYRAKGGSINKEVLRLAGPAIVSNITVPLLGLCDTTISGHLGNVASIGAISVGAMMINVIVWLLTFLRMGTSGLSATAYGRGSVRESRNVLEKSLLLAISASGLILLLQIPLLKLLLWYTRPGDEVASLASEYFSICIWGVPGQLLLMAVTGWFIGQQNTRIPMVLAIGTNIINIILSVWLSFGLKMGIRGIAVGTLTANWAGAICGLIWCRSIKIKGDNEIKGEIGWGNFFRINGDLFLRSAFVMLVSLSMTSFGARLGESILAVNAVMMQFFIFFSYFMDGFAFAGEAMIGKYHGEENGSMLRRSVKVLIRWGIYMSVGFFLIYLTGSGEIASLITNQTGVLEGVREMKWWVVMLPPITVFAFIFDGIYIGLTRTRMMLVSTMAGCCLFFIISFSGGGFPDNNRLLWTGFELYLLMRGVILALDYAYKVQKNY